MKRLLWLGAGLAIGALVVRAVSKRMQRLTPGGVAESVSASIGGLGETVREFVEDVRDGMAQREDEIHRAFAEGEALDGAAALPWARGVGEKFYSSRYVQDELYQEQQEGDTRR